MTSGASGWVAELQALISSGAVATAASCVVLDSTFVDVAVEFASERDAWMEQVDRYCDMAAERTKRGRESGGVLRVSAYDEERVCPLCGVYFMVTVHARPGRTKKFCSTCCAQLHRQPRVAKLQ
jgi:hypothetical protein